jgi:hypothetical protein
MDFYSYDTEVKIVMAHTGVSRQDAKKIVGIVRSMRDRLPPAQKPGTRACIMIGKGLRALNGCDSLGFEQLCIDVIAAKTSSNVELIEKQGMVKDILKELA